MEPAFDELCWLYAVEMQGFGSLTNLMIFTNAVVNAIIIGAVAFLVLRAVGTTVCSVQHASVAVRLAITVPSSAARRMADYYKGVNAALLDVEHGADSDGAENDKGAVENLEAAVTGAGGESVQRPLRWLQRRGLTCRAGQRR